MKSLSDLFVSEDRRRKRVRLTRLSWVAGGVVLVLAAALIVLGVKGMWASVPMRPLATPMPTAAATPVKERSIDPGGCPDDPADWRLRPYTLPGIDRELYAIDPVCVMGEVEQAFRAYLEAKREHGRRWTHQLEERFRSPAGFTAPLSGDTVHELTGPPTLFCSEEVESNGAAAKFEYYVVFYTASEEGPVADVLFVSKPLGPYVRRQYDCETGELVEETEEDGTKILVAYWPMVYEEGRWRTGHRYDVYRYVPSDKIDPRATVALVLNARGRSPSSAK